MSAVVEHELPLLAQPYIADFEQLARMLARISGFLLQPVEAPAPDLARAFAAWLVHQGWHVRIRELGDGLALRELAGELARPADSTEGMVVLVVQSGEIDDAAMRPGFAAINMARDSIARAMPVPIFWWGTASFLQRTWSCAPDFWSVAATPFRIPIRRLPDLPAHIPLGVFWWTGAVHKELAAWEHELSTVGVQGDPVEVARVGIALAEAQLLRGDHLAARTTLGAMKAGVHEHARTLVPRWNLLEGAVGAAMDANAGLSVDQLRDQIRKAELGGAQRRELGLRVKLAERLESGESAKVAEAVREYARARRLTAALGDIGATLALDAHIMLDLAFYVDEELRAEVERFAASTGSATEDPTNRALAALIRAKLAMMSQSFESSDVLAREALGVALEADISGLAMAARGILAWTSLARGDFAGCLTEATAFLEDAIAADNLQMRLQAHGLRARARAELGEPREAAREIVDNWDDYVAFDQRELIGCVLLSAMSELARQTGDPAQAAMLAILSVLTHISEGRLPGREWLATDLDALAADEPGVVRALAAVLEFSDGIPEGELGEGERERLGLLVEVLNGEVRRLDAALKTAAVEAFDPDTWRGGRAAATGQRA